MVWWPDAAKKAVKALVWENSADTMMRDLEQRFSAAQAIPEPPAAAPSASDPGGAQWRTLDEQTSGWRPADPGQTRGAPPKDQLGFPTLASMTEHWFPKPTPGGTPAAMPSAPGLVDATITSGPRPGQTLQPGESVGSVTLGAAPERAGDYRAYARSVAQQYGVDPDIFERQINQESGFQPWGADGKPLGSSAGAQGIAQFMPGTAAGYGVDVNDPYSSLDGAARHMRDLLRANNGNYRFALAAYNAGQGNVDKWGEGVFDDDFANGQTRDYVNIILGPGSARPGRISMNTAAPASPSGAAASPLGAGDPPTSAGLPPSVAQRWKAMYGREPTADEASELMSAMGVA